MVDNIRTIGKCEKMATNERYEELKEMARDIVRQEYPGVIDAYAGTEILTIVVDGFRLTKHTAEMVYYMLTNGTVIAIEHRVRGKCRGCTTFYKGVGCYKNTWVVGHDNDVQRVSFSKYESAFPLDIGDDGYTLAGVLSFMYKKV